MMRRWKHWLTMPVAARVLGLVAAMVGQAAVAAMVVKPATNFADVMELAAFDRAELKREIQVRLADAKARGDKPGELRALRDKFTFLQPEPGEPDEIVQIDGALVQARALGDIGLEASLLSAKGGVVFTRGSQAEGLALHERAIALAERSGDEDLQIQAYYEYGVILFGAFRHEPAILNLERGLAMSAARQEKGRQAALLNYIAVVLKLSDTAGEKEIWKVEAYLQRAMALLSLDQHRELVLNLMEILGQTYSKLGKLREARMMWERQLAGIQAHKLPNSTIGIHYGLGMIDLQEGNPGAAKLHFESALQAHPNGHDWSVILACSWTQLGVAESRLGHQGPAWAALAKARPALDKIAYPKYDVEYQAAVAEVAIRGGDHKLAYEASRRQLEIERTMLTGDAAKRMEELSVKFDTRLKDADNQLLKAEQAQLETKRTALALALALTLLVVAGGMYFFWMQWKQRRRFEVLAMRDELTGAPNRRSVMEHLKREFAKPASDRKGLTVGVMDIDFFKKVNDSYGHDAGDAVLKAFYKTCRDKLRPDDVLGRWGGEEFVLVTRSANVQIVFDRLLEAVKAMDLPELQGERTITFSMGVCVVEGDVAPEVDAVLARADEGLYAAKEAGRARCCPAPIVMAEAPAAPVVAHAVAAKREDPACASS